MSNEKREKIFNAYSDNLEILIKNGLIQDVREIAEKPYICPICLNEFTETHLDQSLKNCLTLEDAPPKSLGGKANVLTCKQCNNRCGALIDTHLSLRIRELDKAKFFKNSEARVKAHYNGLTVNGTMKIDDKGLMQLFVGKDNNNPATLEAFVKQTPKDTLMSFTFMPAKVDDNRLKMALLKTAYLLMFQKYGYALIFDKEYDRIREQLRNPSKSIYPMDFWFMGPFPVELTKIVPFVIEKGIESIMPFFVLKSDRLQYVFAAILPINSRPIEETIEALRNKFSETPKFKSAMKKFDERYDFLNNPEHVKELLEFVKSLQ